jgi:hypothetical protein
VCLVTVIAGLIKIIMLFKIAKCLQIVAAVIAYGKCCGQNLGLGSWNIINIKYAVNEKWSVFGEAQLRSLKFYKGGVNYRFHPNVVVTLAAGDYDTYREGGNFITPKNNAEFRLWPQIILTQSINKFKIEQRYRAEFRFTSNGYRNRFRYRPGITYPFGKNKLDYKPYQINVSNELFFTDREPYFERNRALVSFGYRMSKYAAVQAGYLHQFDYKINDETGRDFLQLGIYIDLFNKTR